MIIFPPFSTHKHLTISWHSCWKAFDKYFWDFLPFPLSLDEPVLESLLQIFNMLHLKSGFYSPAGTSHRNPMTLLMFSGWMGWRTCESSEFVTGATSATETRELVHSCSAAAVPCCMGTPAWLLSELLVYGCSAMPELLTQGGHLLLMEILPYTHASPAVSVPGHLLRVHGSTALRPD